MVAIIAKQSEEDAFSLPNTAVYKQLLKAREEHARAQTRDYSHVFRNKTKWELFRLSALAMAIEFAYAAETSFVSPILLQIGIDHKHMTMAWGLSPLIGFFMSPLLGSLSDRCHLNWGRRRPVITLLSFGILLGLVLVPYGKDLGLLLGDVGYNYTVQPLSPNVSSANLVSDDPVPSISNYKFAVILTIIGMVLLDFDADTCQTPARTYLLDMCTAEDQPRALTTFTLFAGVGGTIGYGLGGIDWESTQIGESLGGNIPTVFALVAVIFVVCFIVTILTFREIPLKLLEQDEMLRPLSIAAVKKELNKNNNNVVYFIKEATTQELKLAEGGNASSYQNNASLELSKKQMAASTTSQSNTKEQSTAESDDKPVSLRQYLKSIVLMPHSMRMLALTNLFCWMGHVTYCLYFTDFVGEAVFQGDPTAAPNSEAFNAYEAGVHFGCWGMSIYALSCSVYSLTVTKLIKWLGTKTVYISGILYYGISMLILGLWPTKWGVLFFSISAGILYGTLFTMPYILLANYHTKNCFRVRNGENMPLKQTRGLGTDVAIISSMVFVAQLVVAMFVGPLVAWSQTTCAILFASTVLSVLAAVAASFVLYI